MNKKKDQHDKAVEDSFPASDPPASTGITGPRVSTPETEQPDDGDQNNAQDEQQQRQSSPGRQGGTVTSRPRSQ